MRPLHWWILAGLIVCMAAGMETYRGQLEIVQVKMDILRADQATTNAELDQVRNQVISLRDASEVAAKRVQKP